MRGRTATRAERRARRQVGSQAEQDDAQDGKQGRTMADVRGTNHPSRFTVLKVLQSHTRHDSWGDLPMKCPATLLCNEPIYWYLPLLFLFSWFSCSQGDLQMKCPATLLCNEPSAPISLYLSILPVFVSLFLSLSLHISCDLWPYFRKALWYHAYPSYSNHCLRGD
jgi:hypothetical protein